MAKVPARGRRNSLAYARAWPGTRIPDPSGGNVRVSRPLRAEPARTSRLIGREYIVGHCGRNTPHMTRSQHTQCFTWNTACPAAQCVTNQPTYAPSQTISDGVFTGHLGALVHCKRTSCEPTSPRPHSMFPHRSEHACWGDQSDSTVGRPSRSEERSYFTHALEQARRPEANKGQLLRAGVFHVKHA